MQPPVPFDFEQRTLLADDPGAAFQQFVWEALSLDDFRNGQLVQHPVRGRDGAIDLVDLSGGRRTALECKFHGGSRADPPVRDWRDVLKTLTTHLPVLCSLSNEDRIRSPYHPWIDSTNPITEYWFCTSATLPNENALDLLRNEIQEGFSGLSILHTNLAHLARLKVKVRAAQHFSGILTKTPSLRYRWFGGLPNGLAPLSAYPSRGRIFRRFLDSETLPYFSYSEFSRLQASPSVRTQPDPASIITALLDGDEQFLVISGPGGVGKTRLGLEIAQAAAHRGISTLVCGAAADEHSVQALARAGPTGQQVLLFVDYAESQSHLVGIAAAVDAANWAGHRIRLVATCRSSALSPVLRALDEFGVTRITLTAEGGGAGDSAYLSWVSTKILQYGGLSDVPGLGAICDRLPVLAAFALHLKRSGEGNFERLFGDLAADTSFEGWAKRRIDSLVSSAADGHGVLQRMAALAAMLPISAIDARAMAASSSIDHVIIERLINDGWVDDDCGNLVGSHDVFADAIISAYIFEPGAQPTLRTRDLAVTAGAHGSVSNMVSNISRLAGHPRFPSIDGLSISIAVRNAHRDAFLASAASWLATPLLAPPDVVSLLATDEDLSHAVATDSSLYGQLSYLTKQLTQDDFVDQSAPQKHIFVKLLSEAINGTGNRSNLLLRRAFEFSPRDFYKTVEKALQTDNTSHEAHYLIVAWLKSGNDRDLVQPFIQHWLSLHCPRNIKSSFVISAWIYSGGDLKFVESDFLSWLSAYDQDESASHVIASWLRGGGSPALIQHHVLKWLGLFGKGKDASYVYANWLNFGGDLDAVEDKFTNWIQTSDITEGSFFSYKHYLRAGGSFSKIEDRLYNWITQYSDSRSTGFAYDLWIKSGGDTERIYSELVNWLNHNGTTPAASYIYLRWLNAGGEMRDVSPHILSWMELHGTTAPAARILRAWCGTSVDILILEPLVISWLESNIDSEQFDFLVSDWLEAGGTFSRVQDITRQWISCNITRSSVTFLLKPISRRPDLDYRTVAAVAAWCVFHCTDPDTITRIGPIYNRYAKGELKQPLTEVVLSVLERISPEMMGYLPTRISIIATLARVIEFNRTGKHSFRSPFGRVQAVHAFLFLSSDLYSDLSEAAHIEFIRSTYLISSLAELVRSDWISLDSDADRLEVFKGWVSTWPRTSLVSPLTALADLKRACDVQAVKNGLMRDLKSRGDHER